MGAETGVTRFDAAALGDWAQDVAALAGSLVHEIKNPLSTLNINAQLMIEEWQTSASPREERTVRRLTVMRGEIQRIERIVNSFLRFTEHQELDRNACDLNRLLADLVERHAEALEHRQVRVRFQGDAELPAIEADDELLAQVFLNLIRNAEQAMPDGGELMVRVARVGHAVEVEVIDTGEGIPPERLERIFRPYFSSKPDGTGLGLPTSLRIVRGHGGTILVESEVGRGSRFIVRLPLSTPPARGPGLASSGPVSSGFSGGGA